MKIKDNGHVIGLNESIGLSECNEKDPSLRWIESRLKALVAASAFGMREGM